MTLIKRGARGEHVLSLQTALNAVNAGGEALTVDGIFGAKTEAAVRAFQKFAGLSDDGIVGRLSSFALLHHIGAQVLAESTPPPAPPVRAPIKSLMGSFSRPR